jgi:alpha-mannosidase
MVPGASILDAVEAGYDVNLTPQHRSGSEPVDPLFTVDNPAIVVEAVKLAEDRSGDVVLRLYEAAGGRAAGRVTAAFAVAEVGEVDLLERQLTRTAVGPLADRSVEVALRPFQILTLRFRPAR